MNKMLGGVAAGGAVAYTWFPDSPHRRVILTSTGALVRGMRSLNQLPHGVCITLRHECLTVFKKSGLVSI